METTETNSPEATEQAQETILDTAPEQQVEATVVGDDGEAESVTTYLDGKYQSVSDLESGYRELQKSYSQKLGSFDGAPEDGYTVPEGELTEADQANLAFLQAWGKDNQLNNDGLSSLAASFNAHQEAQKTVQMDNAYKELGENADRRLANVRDYLIANLGDEATAALAKNMNDAASIVALETLIQKSGSAKPAPQQSTPTINKEKVEAMRFKTNEHGERLMSVDPEYRAQVLKAEAQLLGGTTKYKVG